MVFTIIKSGQIVIADEDANVVTQISPYSKDPKATYI